MIVTLLLLALFLSFIGHIAALVTYVTKRTEGSLKTFINTTLSNVTLAGTCIVVFLTKPHLLRDINLVFISWIMSGVVMFVTLGIKIKIFITIYRRAKDPANYHLNFFGKKVLHSTVVKKMELAIFFGTIPFFLLSGSYFIARLLNFFLYKHL
ncbi:MAG: hypothetical protein BWY23_01951 [Spirochaetes bacterium ADurb.Bin218]|jgi:hypothetical protein|nr:hypothetical protein [Spirochaetota bacterium]OQA96578.1 MAG: hypothetical protein BWY23_01951 [Spirochaetes bacterium ADurb.Bin218]HOQ12737.1 hypothetical protein [Spirochaetota bacterium]HOV09236.1 hypothetical protein [Spirochaetota bacterium]